MALYRAICRSPGPSHGLYRKVVVTVGYSDTQPIEEETHEIGGVKVMTPHTAQLYAYCKRPQYTTIGSGN